MRRTSPAYYPKRDPPTASDVASFSHALLDLEAKLLPNRTVETTRSGMTAPRWLVDVRCAAHAAAGASPRT